MTIEPRTLRGLRDYLPVQMIARQEMIAAIREVYERYGFVPLDTPAIEAREILTGSQEDTGELKIFRFEDPDGRPAGLRFDLTVPLARVVAMNPELPMPFKRYHVAQVWRGDEPAPGRFREFMQFDIDIVGASSMTADTEIVAVMHDTMEALGITRFLIRLNNRKLLNTLVSLLGIDPFFTADVFRTLDKLEKTDPEQVRAKLTQAGPPGVDQKEVPADVRCIGLPEAVADRVMQFVSIRGSSDEVLVQLKSFFGGYVEATAGIRELEEIVSGLRAQGIPEEHFTIDLSVARGLGYYTGPVFETTLLDLPSYGSVFSGGRFDGLIGRFTGTDIPATGSSIGVDRLFAALDQLGLIKSLPSRTQVLVTVFDPKQIAIYQAIARELRQAGFNTDLYTGDGRIKGQFRYGDFQGIQIAVIAGPDELASDAVSVKDLRQAINQEGKQQLVPRAQLVSHIRSLLTRVVE